MPPDPPICPNRLRTTRISAPITHTMMIKPPSSQPNGVGPLPPPVTGMLAGVGVQTVPSGSTHGTGVGVQGAAAQLPEPTVVGVAVQGASGQFALVTAVGELTAVGVQTEPSAMTHGTGVQGAVRQLPDPTAVGVGVHGAARQVAGGKVTKVGVAVQTEPSGRTHGTGVGVQGAPVGSMHAVGVAVGGTAVGGIFGTLVGHGMRVPGPQMFAFG